MLRREVIENGLSVDVGGDDIKWEYIVLIKYYRSLDRVLLLRGGGCLRSFGCIVKVLGFLYFLIFELFIGSGRIKIFGFVIMWKY